MDRFGNYLWLPGQRYVPENSVPIIDASIIAAPKQRNTDGEKRCIPAPWAHESAKLRQKDPDVRWTVK